MSIIGSAYDVYQIVDGELESISRFPMSLELFQTVTVLRCRFARLVIKDSRTEEDFNKSFAEKLSKLEFYNNTVGKYIQYFDTDYSKKFAKAIEDFWDWCVWKFNPISSDQEAVSREQSIPDFLSLMFDIIKERFNRFGHLMYQLHNAYYYLAQDYEPPSDYYCTRKEFTRVFDRLKAVYGSVCRVSECGPIAKDILNESLNFFKPSAACHCEKCFSKQSCPCIYCFDTKCFHRGNNL